MSSDEENRYNNNETEENVLDEELNVDEESHSGLDHDLSDSLDVNLATNDGKRDETEVTSPSPEHEGKIGTEELPHSGNTKDFKEKFETASTETERRAERRRERRRRRKLTEEEDGPTEGTTKTTLNKFEKGEIDDSHFHKTDLSSDTMASSGMVSTTTAKFKSGNVHSSSDDENRKSKDDKDVVESGTAASRRKALQEHAEEAKKSKSSSAKVLEQDRDVLSPGIAATTRAKLQKMASEEKILERQVDNNAPKRGTAMERRAKFEEKARHSSSDEGPKLVSRSERRSKWPEPKTNYRQRRAELRKSTSTDEEGSAVEKENAKNIEKSSEVEKHNEDMEASDKSNDTKQTSTVEEPKSPVKTADIRRKLVKMLSEEEKPPSQSIDRVGSARPSAGTARNLRARFEAGPAKQEESHFTSKKPSISMKSGYASKVKERFESGEVARHRTPSTADEAEDINTETTTARRRRTSSAKSNEGDPVIMSRSAKELRSRFENPSQNNNQVKRNFVLRPKTGSTNISSKFNKAGPTVNKCTYCSKTVYPVEMITADNKPFHKFCFKCTECRTTLRLGNYAALQGQIYCKPHFKQLFKVKGNYDEGFGRQQHKKNWEEKTRRSSSGEELKDSEKKREDNSTSSDVTSAGEQANGGDLLNGYEETQTNGHVADVNHEEHLYDEVEA